MYPDLHTALIGTYRDGRLERGQAATLVACTIEGGLAVPQFSPPRSQEVISASCWTWRPPAGDLLSQ